MRRHRSFIFRPRMLDAAAASLPRIRNIRGHSAGPIGCSLTSQPNGAVKRDLR
jgi:hypothetical protein